MDAIMEQMRSFLPDKAIPNASKDSDEENEAYSASEKEE